MSRRVGFDSTSADTQSGVSIWAKLLSAQEEILWQGRPGFGVSLNSSTIKALVVIAVVFAFLGPKILAQDQFVGSTNYMFDVPVIGGISGPWILVLAGGWVVIWGLAQTDQTPFYTHYMLSDHRAYIAKTFLWKRVKSYEITPFKAIEFDGKETGSIIFAQETRRAENGKKRSFPVGFIKIAGASKVYQMMVDIQRRKAQ